MADQSFLVFVETCQNDLIYLKNQIPQLLEVADKIVMVDDYSTDGTKEWVEGLDKIEFYQRQFDTCANQFDFALQKAAKDNTWIFNITAIELPTIWFFENIREVLNNCDMNEVDRIWTSVFHLRSERTMCQELGGEMRLFRNDVHHNCLFTDYPHERLEGKFDGHCVPQVDEKFAFVRFRQADPKKIQEWKTTYIEKGVYSLKDIKRRLDYPTVVLPDFIRYKINDELREYLKW